MTTIKKTVEKQIKKEDLEKILWLHRGINVLDEKGRKAALESSHKFIEKEGKLISPAEFHSILFSKHVKEENMPLKYHKELDRYRGMFVKNFSELLELPYLENAEIGKILGIPDADENLFELKKKGKQVGFIHLNKKDMTVDFIENTKDLPKDFKKKISRKEK